MRSSGLELGRTLPAHARLSTERHANLLEAMAASTRNPWTPSAYADRTISRISFATVGFAVEHLEASHGLSPYDREALPIDARQEVAVISWCKVARHTGVCAAKLHGSTLARKEE